jgi:hypothetical protein
MAGLADPGAAQPRAESPSRGLSFHPKSLPCSRVAATLANRQY